MADRVCPGDGTVFCGASRHDWLGHFSFWRGCYDLGTLEKSTSDHNERLFAAGANLGSDGGGA